MIALDAIVRFSHSRAMRIDDVTPEWIAQMRDARQLKDVDIYTAVGIKQDFFSKSMSGTRKFQRPEKERIFAFFCGPANENLPIASVAAAELPLLTEDNQRLVLDLIHSLRDAAGKVP